MAPSTAREHRAKGKPILRAQQFADGLGGQLSNSQKSVDDLREEAFACATTDAERQLIAMFADSTPPAEIAKELGKSLAWVYDTRQRLLARFMERNPEYA